MWRDGRRRGGSREGGERRRGVGRMVVSVMGTQRGEGETKGPDNKVNKVLCKNS